MKRVVTLHWFLNFLDVMPRRDPSTRSLNIREAIELCLEAEGIQRITDHGMSRSPRVFGSELVAALTPGGFRVARVRGSDFTASGAKLERFFDSQVPRTAGVTTR